MCRCTFQFKDLLISCVFHSPCYWIHFYSDIFIYIYVDIFKYIYIYTAVHPYIYINNILNIYILKIHIRLSFLHIYILKNIYI